MTTFMDKIFPMEVAEKIATSIEFPEWLMKWIASVTYSLVGSAVDSFEQTIKRSLPGVYAAVNSFCERNAHPFAARLPYLNPWYVVFSVLVYPVGIAFFAVLGKICGKGQYRLLGLVHNISMYFLSLYMGVGILVSARAANYSLWNNAAGTSEKEYRLAKFLWLFYISKVFEWIDTLLMLLKHNYRQISFLHVYHHLTVYVIWWLGNLMAPCGEAYYSSMVNCGVHVVMYGYYLLTTLFPNGPVRQRLYRFKFIITKGQITQFIFNIIQAIYNLGIVPEEELHFHKDLMKLLFWYMVSLLVLFLNFFFRNVDRKEIAVSSSKRSASKPMDGQKEFKLNGGAKISKVDTIMMAQPLDIKPVFNKMSKKKRSKEGFKE